MSDPAATPHPHWLAGSLAPERVLRQACAHTLNLWHRRLCRFAARSETSPAMARCVCSYSSRRPVYRCRGRHCRCSALACSTQIRREDRRRRISRPSIPFGQRRVVDVLRFPRWGADLVRELVGQAPVALVDLGLHGGVLVKLLRDALGAHGSLVVHPSGTGGAGPQGAALVIADGGGLDRVLLTFAGDEGPSAGAVRLGPADLGLGAVDPQRDVLGVGVGEHVLHGPQPQAGPVGYRGSRALQATGGSP